MGLASWLRRRPVRIGRLHRNTSPDGLDGHRPEAQARWPASFPREVPRTGAWTRLAHIGPHRCPSSRVTPAGAPRSCNPALWSRARPAPRPVCDLDDVDTGPRPAVALDLARTFWWQFLTVLTMKDRGQGVMDSQSRVRLKAQAALLDRVRRLSVPGNHPGAPGLNRRAVGGRSPGRRGLRPAQSTSCCGFAWPRRRPGRPLPPTRRCREGPRCPRPR